MSDDKPEVQEQEPKKTRARVVEPSAPVYYTGKPVTQDSVFGWLVGAVLDNPGISAEDLRGKMMGEFSPKTSQKFGEPYCQAYVRGMFKEGYATSDKSAAVMELVEPERKARKASGSGSGSSAAEPGAPPPLSDNAKEALNIVSELAGGEVGAWITMDAVIEKVGKPKRSVAAVLRSLEGRGLVQIGDGDVEDEEGKTSTTKVVALKEVVDQEETEAA